MKIWMRPVAVSSLWAAAAASAALPCRRSSSLAMVAAIASGCSALRWVSIPVADRFFLAVPLGPLEMILGQWRQRTLV